MAGFIILSSRNLPRNVIRISSKLFDTESHQVYFRRRTYEQGAIFCCRSRSLSSISSCRCWFEQEIEFHKQFVSTRHFRSSRILYDDVKIVNVPPFAESVSEGDVKWEKNVGDAVAEDEVVLEIETDKTSVAVPSPGNGVIEERYVEDGATVKAGQKLFKIRITGDAPAAKPKEDAKPSPPPPSEAKAQEPSAPPTPKPEAPSPPPSAAAPPPRKPPPPPSAPSSSIPVAAIRHAQAIEAATVKVPPSDPTKEIAGTRTETRVKMSRMRLRIAERLKDAQNTNAMLTTFNEIDMSSVIEFRKANLDAFQKKYGIKLGFMSPFLKAAAYALQDQPIVNAVIEGNEIIYRDYIDISVAVASPKGLVVPVVRNVEAMNFADIELEIHNLGEKARKGTLAIEDMDGGTFTISNGGVFGSLLGTPIINPPQSAILGMHGSFDRPIAKNGQVVKVLTTGPKVQVFRFSRDQDLLDKWKTAIPRDNLQMKSSARVVIRPMMYIALTYDHRLIDGREAVLFLRKIKAAVEDPRVILAGL